MVLMLEIAGGILLALFALVIGGWVCGKAYDLYLYTFHYEKWVQR